MHSNTAQLSTLNLKAVEPKLWLSSIRYDISFFVLSGLAALLLVIPYRIWGNETIWPIYNGYLIFFGLPHNYLTWATLFPGDSKKQFQMDAIYKALFYCALLCLFIPFTFGTNLGDWILSFVAYTSLWHAYRQHQGICKMYDHVQIKRTGDASLISDRKVLDIGHGLIAGSPMIWAFTHEEIRYLLTPNDYHLFIHPVIPIHLFYLYALVTALLFVYGLKRTVVDRMIASKFVPWPQVSLLIVSALVYTVPFYLIPLEALPVSVAIGTIFHNIQYFGFVWAFESSRSMGMEKSGLKLGLPQKLARSGAWKSYFSIALVYSFAIVALYVLLPKTFGLGLMYFVGLSHYIVDGLVWRRNVNFSMSKVLESWK